ncbi:DNA cytosine methyltransferase [Aequorivita lipolytica]|uniref:Cytosine-specific methyltransferase n=1 Tax=Aequorivita lipolytica TaxID=153267 RepID=A0A5C6YTJ4_9FLAO|nr:DNA (cytosine-5-)-methyltransferase [Aequorivita lipolytica]TXD70778.1 DNA cytosine methyltransferase [Aequorivita lipolytica]SRX49822.1 Modification methylase HaeIII [Aequorivita lipolytica]
MSYNFIDLFAGAGGLSEGFIQAGFEPVAHVEIEKSACNTLKTRTAYHYLNLSKKKEIYLSYLKDEISRENLYDQTPTSLLDSVINLPIGTDHNKTIFTQIDKLLGKRKVDLIIGGPPCQAYSLVGRARSKTGMAGDSRNYLFIQYANYLEKYQPKMFVFENVLGLKSARKGHYLAEMEKLFNEKGYQIKLFTLEARNFGVLQNRKRVIIIGWQKDKQLNIPNLEEIVIENNFEVEDLLKDLPSIKAGEGKDKFLNYHTSTTDYLKTHSLRNGIDILTQHVARPNNTQDKEIYEIAVKKWQKNQERLNYNDLPERLKTHHNRTSFIDRFKVVAADLSYSQTIVAHISKDGHYYIHPDIKQNRSISVREAARLQSFPDDYYFEGEREGANRTAAFKQIGNAVPPLMAKVIAENIKEIL